MPPSVDVAAVSEALAAANVVLIDRDEAGCWRREYGLWMQKDDLHSLARAFWPPHAAGAEKEGGIGPVCPSMLAFTHALERLVFGGDAGAVNRRQSCDFQIRFGGSRPRVFPLTTAAAAAAWRSGGGILPDCGEEESVKAVDAGTLAGILQVLPAA